MAKRWISSKMMFAELGIDKLEPKTRRTIHARLYHLRKGLAQEKELADGATKEYRTSIQLVEGRDWKKDGDTDTIFYAVSSLDAIKKMLESYLE